MRSSKSLAVVSRPEVDVNQIWLSYHARCCEVARRAMGQARTALEYHEASLELDRHTAAINKLDREAGEIDRRERMGV